MSTDNDMNNIIKDHLDKLARNSRNMEQFIGSILRFPHFYLRTDDQKRLTKKDLREFYQERHK